MSKSSLNGSIRLISLCKEVQFDDSQINVCAFALSVNVSATFDP